MATTIKAPALTSRQRLRRGLHHTATGPVDIARAAVGLTARGVTSAASTARTRYRSGRLAATAQEKLAALPAVFPDRRQQHRRRRLWIVGGVAAAVAGGAAAFAVIRQSSRPEPSPRPPSVDVEARP
ncbi:cell wall synthesis protein CwsA [Mycobacterium sp. MYCO198283]|uniref:cell wall synthesis protein CwsA n=1 Tax=Mycobacterium sp. MYCO198283 TaxID=2883505 RepID=UPI001E298D0E|nr:cell wall synthesis protein CwsA [Mycobacterium sp. MYCO198283]MCG5433076.1 cell wall synthesis protein CwsA [Mycobacterium sp. MYCO198283]